MAQRIVALVPMGGHSERIRGKNVRPLAGRPLLSYVLSSLRAVPQIAEIVVNTDDEEIARLSAVEGARVIERPQSIRGGMISMNDILLHDVQQVQADWYLQTHATNPFLRSDTVRRAIEALTAAPDRDSLFSVTRVFKRYWDNAGRPVNHDPLVLVRTQDLPPFYEENSCLYLFTRDILEQRRSRIGERPLLFEMDAMESIDIDVPFDFQLAELMMSGAFGEQFTARREENA